MISKGFLSKRFGFDASVKNAALIAGFAAVAFTAAAVSPAVAMGLKAVAPFAVAAVAGHSMLKAGMSKKFAFATTQRGPVHKINLKGRMPWYTSRL